MAELWNKTGIVHGLAGREGEKRISYLLTMCKNTFKVPMVRRQEGFAMELQVLFDVTVCQHSGDETCNYESSVKIPPI